MYARSNLMNCETLFYKLQYDYSVIIIITAGLIIVVKPLPIKV